MKSLVWTLILGSLVSVSALATENPLARTLRAADVSGMNHAGYVCEVQPVSLGAEKETGIRGGVQFGLTPEKRCDPGKVQSFVVYWRSPAEAAKSQQKAHTIFSESQVVGLQHDLLQAGRERWRVSVETDRNSAVANKVVIYPATK